MELRSWEEMEETIGGSLSSRYIYDVFVSKHMVKTTQHFKNVEFCNHTLCGGSGVFFLIPYCFARDDH